MNLGIYVNSLAINEETEMAVNSLNKGVEEGLLSGASIFFDTVGFNPLPMKCGCFNSADLWNFTGTLIASSMASLFRAMGVVNKASIVYYYGWEEKTPIFSLIRLAEKENLKIVCKNEESNKELFRLTGRKSDGIVNDFNVKEIAKLVTS